MDPRSVLRGLLLMEAYVLCAEPVRRTGAGGQWNAARISTFKSPGIFSGYVGSRSDGFCQRVLTSPFSHLKASPKSQA